MKTVKPEVIWSLYQAALADLKAAYLAYLISSR